MDYKKILEGVVDIINTAEKSDIGFANICAYIGENCPELQKSNEERLRKTTIAFLKDFADKGYENAIECIDWLEKRGEQIDLVNKEYWRGYREGKQEILDKHSEQKPTDKVEPIEWSGKIKSRKAKGVLKEMLDEKIKPTDKVEPKFQKGDWVVHNKANFVFKVVSIGSNGYEVVNRENNKKTISFDNDVNYHLWTIQDAKDGDLIYVSTEEKGIQAIFHEYKNKTIFFHCYLCRDFVQGGYMPIDRVELVYPLQKTHHKRFFEKMHEADCEWDVCKKTLKKIEQKPADNEMKELLRTEYEKGRADALAEVHCLKSERNPDRKDETLTKLIEEIDKLDEERKQNAKYKSAKSGFAHTVRHFFLSNEIKTLDELLSLGRKHVARCRNIGKMTMWAIDKALENLYGITEW